MATKVPTRTAIRIVHATNYSYNRPVVFGPHRLLLRPRDGHDLRLLSSSISINPLAALRWHFDTFGNSVATAEFSKSSDRLEIRSELLLRRFSHEDFLASPDRVGSAFPVQYSPDDIIDLAPFMALENPDERVKLEEWLNEVLDRKPDETLEFLRYLSDTIHSQLVYNRRERMGTQTALTTMRLGSGSCRDFALLFMEASRCFGFAARFVTGYLNGRTIEGSEHVGGGSTHAWAEIYLPEEGWIEFDPTNRIVAGSDLIRVAVTRTPSQATPISGTYEYDLESVKHEMDVTVNVRNEMYDD